MEDTCSINNSENENKKLLIFLQILTREIDGEVHKSIHKKNNTPRRGHKRNRAGVLKSTFEKI